MSTVAERVAAGMAFLDEHDPDWWRADVGRAIDLDGLDMGHGGMCILGQRCPLELPRNDWDTGYHVLAGLFSGADTDDEADDWAADRGFQIPADTRDDYDGDDYYDDLAAEWRRVIEARRAS